MVNNKVKKICGTACALALSVTALVGCNVVTTNTAKYYNQIVLTVGDTSYTKKQLLETYYNRDYQYVRAGYYTAEEGVKNSVKYLVERGLFVDYLKKEYFGAGKTLGELTENDYKIIRKSTFNSMQQQLDSLETTIRKERGIEEDESSSSSEETTLLRDSYNEYTPTVVVVQDENGVDHYVYNMELIEDEDLSSEDIPEHFVQSISDEAVSREAWTRYVYSLQQAAKLEGKSTAEKDVVSAEESRIMELYTQDRYIEKFQKYFKIHEKFGTTITIDGVDYYELNEELQNSTIKYIKNQYKTQKTKYDTSLTDYYTAMKSYNTTPVFYHPVEGKFMNVTHILLNFSQIQKDAVTALNNERETTPMTDEEYNARLEQIALGTVVKYNDDNGNVITASAQEVYEMIENYVNSSDDPVRRAQLFNDMIYKFNDDPGIMNSAFDYVVDLDDNIYGTTEEPSNIMVRSFTLAARELYDDTPLHGAGNMSGLVISEYGYHIILNTGAVGNFAATEDDVTTEVLMSRFTQLNNYKDLFNYSFDKVAPNSNYDTEVSNIVANLKSITKIVYYENRYKDLWK